MTTDTAAQKAALATVKSAEKAYASAEKKSSAARERYLELQADTNRKARELAHARTNPDLYDDDPLTVVSPGQNLTGTKDEPEEFVPVKVHDQVKPGDTLMVRVPQPQPTVTVDASTAYVEPIAKPAPEPADETGDVDVLDGDALAEQLSEPDPWNIPVAQPQPEPAKPVRKRKTAKEKAAEAAAARPEGEPDDAFPPSINSGSEPPATMAPAF